MFSFFKNIDTTSHSSACVREFLTPSDFFKLGTNESQKELSPVNKEYDSLSIRTKVAQKNLGLKLVGSNGSLYRQVVWEVVGHLISIHILIARGSV